MGVAFSLPISIGRASPYIATLTISSHGECTCLTALHTHDDDSKSRSKACVESLMTVRPNQRLSLRTLPYRDSSKTATQQQSNYTGVAQRMENPPPAGGSLMQRAMLCYWLRLAYGMATQHCCRVHLLLAANA
ncbi:hypothetical protein NX059_006410 [Plenodomus lindquistii]|nr:hypothetical protein NX059_006410 [Plenodomus lindquistii]